MCSLAIQPFDKCVNAVALKGLRFITGPNVYYLNLFWMTHKQHFHLGEHEHLLWPIPQVTKPLAFCPKTSGGPRPTRSIFSTLLTAVATKLFCPLKRSPISGLRFLSGAILASTCIILLENFPGDGTAGTLYHHRSLEV